MEAKTITVVTLPNGATQCFREIDGQRVAACDEHGKYFSSQSWSAKDFAAALENMRAAGASVSVAAL